MAGARSTGKSIYIAVMIKQLQHRAKHMAMEVRPVGKTAQIFAERYEKPLFEERQLMAPTPPIHSEDSMREPLVFEITLRGGSRHHLLIRDVAGEDLERPGDQPNDLSFFANADAVFFLFDPLKVQEIKNQLHGLVEEAALGGDPESVMRTTLGLIEGGHPRIGVIMSKFDHLQALGRIEDGNDWTRIMANSGAAFFRDPGPLAPTDDVDGALLHAEVRSLLIMVGAGALVDRVEVAGRQSGGARFFAVSALGESPQGVSVPARGIAPFRCLDPLKWALSGTGVL